MTQQYHCWYYTLRISKHKLKRTYALQFIAAQFTIAKCSKQPSCPSVNEWIKNWCIYAVEYYAAERKKELLPFTTTGMELKSIILSEVSQAGKDKYHVTSPISGT